jgi:hypothetical protein
MLTRELAPPWTLTMPPAARAAALDALSREMTAGRA